MSVTIRFRDDGRVATVVNGVWVSDEPLLAEVLQITTRAAHQRGCDPQLDYVLASYACQVHDAEIIHKAYDEVPILDRLYRVY